MDLSVIIPVYNAGTLINRCLDSVFSQQGEYQIEVICVDDGSTDNSVELIKGRTEQHIVLLQQENAGPAAARNKGMRVAKGRYMAYLDADDYWLSGFIEKTISFLDSHLECIAVTVGQRHITTSGDHIAPSILKNDTDLTPMVLDDFFSFWTQHNHVCTGSIVIRTDIARKTGGQREDLRICEDWEFWAYLATYGKFGFIPEVLFVSDGGIITAIYGWKKYKMRFKEIPSFDKWFERLNEKLSVEQIEIIKPILNNVIRGESRAMICSGDFKQSYDNLKYYYKGFTEPYPIKIWKCGKLIYYIYAVLWRTYQYYKINKGVLYRIFTLK